MSKSFLPNTDWRSKETTPTGKSNTMKNKSYIWVSLIVLIFGILVIPEIVKRYKNNDVVKGERLDKVTNHAPSDGKLETIAPAPKFEFYDQKINKKRIDIKNKIFQNPNFGIVSIAIDPDRDTAAVLKSHADLLGVKSSNWHFLTGDKKYIY